ncbi:rod shape-determining protein MreC [Crocinitomix sp.]|nr:rod shape-determining protein MreC [Crocinitomix sp.]
MVAWFVEKKYNIDKHFSLSDANEALIQENARLRAQLPESFYRLQGDVFYVNDTIKKQQFQYIPATVIDAKYTKRNNYFTLNQGSSQGIEIGMGVISPEGVVGIVTDVSANYSIVMTVLSEKIRVNVKLKKNNEYWLLNWDGLDYDYGQISEVKRDIPIEVGDEVVTRGGGDQISGRHFCWNNSRNYVKRRRTNHLLKS